MASTAATSFLAKIGKTNFTDLEALQGLKKDFEYNKEQLGHAALHWSSMLSQCQMPKQAAAISMIMCVHQALYLRQIVLPRQCTTSPSHQ
jgi:hypothetical protein